MRQSLKLKIVVATFFLLAMPLILTGFVLRADAETLLARLLQSRYEYVVLDLRATIQTGFDLRLTLNQMANLRAATQRAFDADDVIQAVEIYGKDGTILYRAGDKVRNQLVPDSWRRAPRETKSRLWRVDDGTSLVVGSDIVGSDGKVVGGIALRAKRASVSEASSAYGMALRRSGAIIFLFGWLAASVGAILLVQPVRRRVAAITRALGEEGSTSGGSEAEALGRETASNAKAIFKAIERAGGVPDGPVAANGDGKTAP